MSEEYLIVYCTCPDEKTSLNLSHLLIENKLASCVNISSNVTSVYSWNNKIEETPEILLIIKTISSKYPQLEKLIIKNHPYECPEIISSSISYGSKKYLEWIKQSIV